MRVSLRGVGKYPFVRPSTAVLDFGSVVVGTSAEKAVQLINATPAACDFAVHRQHPDDTDAVFSVNVTSGRLAGDAQMAATVTFTPSAPGAFTREAFVVTTPGGTPTLLTCTGTAVSPGVRCSATAVAFGPVAVGSVTAQRFVQLDNTCGDLAVRYSFDACIGSDGAAVFEFTDGAGVIPPKSFAQIGISFRPGTSAVYHRRVTILLADAPPLGLDLLGTGFTPKARPPDVGLPELLTWRSAASATSFVLVRPSNSLTRASSDTTYCTMPVVSRLQAMPMLMAVSCLSPVSTQMEIPALARLSIASGTPSCSLSSMAVHPTCKGADLAHSRACRHGACRGVGGARQHEILLNQLRRRVNLRLAPHQAGLGGLVLREPGGEEGRVDLAVGEAQRAQASLPQGAAASEASQAKPGAGAPPHARGCAAPRRAYRVPSRGLACANSSMCWLHTPLSELAGAGASRW